jgi:hypothetical protein
MLSTKIRPLLNGGLRTSSVRLPTLDHAHLITLCLVPFGGDMVEVVSPFKEGTTASRLLEKRGDGGYMIIMQTEDAKKRRQYIESQGLAKVITAQENVDTVFVQYHPKGIKGQWTKSYYCSLRSHMQVA